MKTRKVICSVWGLCALAFIAVSCTGDEMENTTGDEHGEPMNFEVTTGIKWNTPGPGWNTANSAPEDGTRAANAIPEQTLTLRGKKTLERLYMSRIVSDWEDVFPGSQQQVLTRGKIVRDKSQFYPSFGLLARIYRGTDPDPDRLPNYLDDIGASCVKDDMVFEFFHDLDQRILRPYQLDDKTFVEYHASPETSVTLYYLLDTGLGTMPEYKSEPLRNVYEGIFTKTFTLFYGETLHYYFQTEDENGVHRTEEKMLTMNLTDDRASSKYQLINQILCARKLEKDPEVKEKLSQYLRQEQYVNEMFVIEKEPER